MRVDVFFQVSGRCGTVHHLIRSVIRSVNRSASSCERESKKREQTNFNEVWPRNLGKWQLLIAYAQMRHSLFSKRKKNWRGGRVWTNFHHFNSLNQNSHKPGSGLVWSISGICMHAGRQACRAETGHGHGHGPPSQLITAQHFNVPRQPASSVFPSNFQPHCWCALCLPTRSATQVRWIDSITNSYMCSPCGGDRS